MRKAPVVKFGMEPINVLSMFDGMACGRLAMERAGIPVKNYYASEVDKYAIQVATKNWLFIQENRNMIFIFIRDWESSFNHPLLPSTTQGFI
jgi:site-specific DNA-cytosine methylase